MNDTGETAEAQLEKFEETADNAFGALFTAAKAVDEFQFALALMVEMRGMQDAGWNTAADANAALDQYIDLLNELGNTRPVAIRVALSLYAYLTEAAGLYEVPKNMLRIISGGFHSLWPFSDLVEKHRITGEAMAPNANRIMKDLLGHASDTGHENLAHLILDFFDADIRHAYAHADYVVWGDGIHLRRRNGGIPRIVSYGDFHVKLNKAITFFRKLQQLVSDAQRSYAPPVLVYGRMNSRDAPMFALVHCDLERKAYGIRSGGGMAPSHEDAMQAAADRRQRGLEHRWASDDELDAWLEKQPPQSTDPPSSSSR